jgi:hypothetical protein
MIECLKLLADHSLSDGIQMMSTRLLVKTWAAVVCGIWLVAGIFGASLVIDLPVQVYADGADKTESDARKAARDENLRLMQRRAQGTTVKVKDSDRAEVELIPKPLFHYTDEPRRIQDATLWGWTHGGRLIAVCKIEKYDHSPERTWLYCFGSLSSKLLDVNWLDGNSWASTKPGVEFQTVEATAQPAKDVAGRLRQMKELANRFEARILVDNVNNNTQQMRLLPRPIHRYEKPVGKVLDGAAFGLTTNGTNPDVILLIELQESENGSPKWMYGLAGMTAGGVTVNLDDREVWSKPFVGQAGRYDTWLWFFGLPELTN